MRVSGTDFMGSQGDVAFEWRGVHGRPPLASPRGRQGSEQVAVTAESRARRPERFPSESCGPWPQWGRGCKVSGRGGLPHPIFLSQGVLPGTVQPAHGCQHHGSEDRPGGPSSRSPLRSLGRVGGLSGHGSADRARILAERPEASAAPPPGSLQGSSFPSGGIPASPRHSGIPSMTYSHGTHSPVSPQGPGLLKCFSEAGARSGRAALFLFVCFEFIANI